MACFMAIVIGASAALRGRQRPTTLTPFLGVNFGGSADVNGSGGTTLSSKFEKKIDYGASLTGMGAGPIGFEIDFGYSPNFFESSDITSGHGFQFTNKSNVTTLTGNLVVGGRNGSIRPYALAGVGLLRTNVQDAAGLFTANTKNDFGMDIGRGDGLFRRTPASATCATSAVSADERQRQPVRAALSDLPWRASLSPAQILTHGSGSGAQAYVGSDLFHES